MKTAVIGKTGVIIMALLAAAAVANAENLEFLPDFKVVINQQPCGIARDEDGRMAFYSFSNQSAVSQWYRRIVIERTYSVTGEECYRVIDDEGNSAFFALSQGEIITEWMHVRYSGTAFRSNDNEYLLIVDDEDRQAFYSLQRGAVSSDRFHEIDVEILIKTETGLGFAKAYDEDGNESLVSLE